MASRTLKKNKRTKQRRSRTRRQRRRQMRGGDFLDFFKPTVETNDTCKEKYDKCLDKVAGKEDNNSFFKIPTFNLFGSSDTEKEDEGIELQEYPVTAVPAAPVVDVAAEQAAADTAAAASAEQAAAAAAEQAAADAAAAEQAAAIVPLPAAPIIDAPTADQSDLYSNNDATPSPAIDADATASQEDTSMGMVPQGNLSTPLLSTGLDAQAEAEENARKNNAMGMELGGGSRKKYKKQRAGKILIGCRGKKRTSRNLYF